MVVRSECEWITSVIVGSVIVSGQVVFNRRPGIWVLLLRCTWHVQFIHKLCMRKTNTIEVYQAYLTYGLDSVRVIKFRSRVN